MAETQRRTRFWAVMSVFVALMLVSLGFLLGPWTLTMALVYVAMWVLFGGALVFIMYPQRGVQYLRISACVLGVLMTLSMIDFVITQFNSGGSLWQPRSPIAGFFIVALPAFAFTIWGGKSRIGKRLLEHGRTQQEQPESDDPL